jgi:hypothetical protein
MSTRQLQEIVNELAADVLYAPDGWSERTVESVIASDLISDILVSEGEAQLLVTSLTSQQMVRTAALIGAVAILLVHRRQAPPGLEAAAREQEIPLFLSSEAKYEACIRLGRLEGSL